MRSMPDPYKDFKDDALRLQALNYRETCRAVTRVGVALCTPLGATLGWTVGRWLGWL